MKGRNGNIGLGSRFVKFTVATALIFGLFMVVMNKAFGGNCHGEYHHEGQG